jgi:hypothetical protein
MVREDIATALAEAGDAFEIAEGQYESGDVSSLRKEYPRMKEAIEKGLDKLREAVM